MNFINKSLAKEGTKGGMKASEGVEASRGVEVLLLPASDFLTRLWALVNSSCSIRLTERLTQGLCQVIQDFGVIVKDRSLNIIFQNGLADPLDMELLEL